MPNYRTSLAFTRVSDGELGSFSENTVEQMTDNAGFPTPRVPLATVTTATDTYLADLAAAQGGGILATAKKNASKAALILLLRQQAAYVQSIAGNDLTLLLSSGFEAASSNRTRIVLPQVLIKTLLSLQSTMFRITVKPVVTSRGYELRYKIGAGDYIAAGFFTSSRNIVLEGLTPGVVYTVQVRAMGGLTNNGDWSDPVSRMAM